MAQIVEPLRREPGTLKVLVDILRRRAEPSRPVSVWTSTDGTSWVAGKGRVPSNGRWCCGGIASDGRLVVLLGELVGPGAATWTSKISRFVYRTPSQSTTMRAPSAERREGAGTWGSSRTPRGLDALPGAGGGNAYESMHPKLP